MALPTMLTIVLIGGVRLLLGNIHSRLDIMPISIAAKSLLFLAYMMLSACLKKESLKAFAVSRLGNGLPGRLIHSEFD